MSVFVTHRGSVNAWECDENDHLNVRFYIAKANEGLPFLLSELGHPPARLASDGARVRIRTQHLRFLQEARKATPLTVVSGIAAQRGGRLTVYSEVRHSLGGGVLATLLGDVELVSGDGTAIRVEVPPSLLCDVPAHGAPRGLDGTPFPPPARSDVARAGFVEIARGCVRPGECDPSGELEAYQYVGRVADGVMNLIASFQTAEELERRSQGVEGSALVELRVTHRARLRAGSLFTVHSGLRAVGTKTFHPVHLVFDEGSGECAAVCEGVAVTMDLRARKAIDLPDARRKRMLAGVVELAR
jgi:acyl-CoA thioester hydrolase